MADYWKSHDRKYCEFCKCWITDNKPSVESHEKGRRHQENVKKKLAYISRTSAKQQKQNERTDISIKRMEKAALEAYKKDIANNADLTSVAINKKLKEENLEIKSGSSKVIWHELKSAEGDVYYWNTITNETKWESPKEAFLTIEQQHEEALAKTKKEMETADKERRKEGLLRMQEIKQEEEENRARLAREKMKERRVVDDEATEQPSGPIIEPGNPSPYGQWQVTKEVEYVDLQLPKQDDYFEAPIEYVPEPTQREFKEKTIENIDDNCGATFFKKRKFGGGNKRNCRQRLDDD